ncbi:hypothetical protein Tco_0581537 [Tanacetum coccineum]
MPTESYKPPDPLFDELYSRTKMSSIDDFRDASLKETKVRVVKGKHRKPQRGIRVSTPGSAGAGSVLRRFHSAKASGKAKDRHEDSPGDNRCNLKFSMGCSDDNTFVSGLNNENDVNEVSNNGSFINSPLDNFALNDLGCHVAKSCGLKTSHDHTSMGDVGNIGVGIASSKDGIAIVETGINRDRDKAGSRTSCEHFGMEGVVNTGVAQTGSQNGIASYKVGGFEFGKKENTNGVFFKVTVGPFFSVNFSNNSSSNPFVKKSVPSSGSVWNNDGFKAFGSSMLSNQFSADVDRFAEKLKLGTEEIALKNGLTSSGVYYFKFKSEDKREEKGAAERVHGMIQNIPLVLNVWEPGIWLEKIEPSSIPIWVCVYNIPMELCNGSGIGKIMSGVGKPLVLVEVSAEDELPNVLEIEYPPLGSRPARVGKLEVKYQWKPPLCTHCKTFGHTTLSCKVRPRSEEEIAAKTLKDVLKVGKDDHKENGYVDFVDDGFTMGCGGRTQSNFKQGYGNSGGGNINFNVQRRGGGFVQRNQYRQKSYSVDVNVKPVGKNLTASKSYSQEINKKPIVEKPVLASTYNHHFRPKVLVRGSGSDKNFVEASLNEDIPVKNSFNVLRPHPKKSSDNDDVEDLGGINVNEEFDSKVWPSLKEEVDILLEAGIYPSRQVRLDWTIHQMDYFYKNCHKFHLDPSCEEDEEDVDSDVEGIAVDMKPWKFVFNVIACDCMDINAAENEDFSNGDTYSFCGLLETHVKKKNLSKICSRVLGRWDWVSNSSSCDSGYGNLVSSVSITLAILCDFIACLDLLKDLLGASKFNTVCNGFRDCVEEIEVEDGFIPVVKRVWSNKVDGFSMFSLVSKLKMLKKPLRKLNFEQGNLFDKVKCLKTNLATVQAAMNADPHNNFLREEELRVLKAYRAALKDEELFLRQKAKVEWLEVGDRNSKYFHNVVKGRRNRNRISYIEDLNGNPFHGNNVGDQFVSHFKNVLGRSSNVLPVTDPDSLFVKKLPVSEALNLVRSVSNEEIKLALFDIDGNKAPGPDGFSSQFFKDSWSVVGDDVCKAVRDFFSNGKLLKEINATVISLVPKVASPSKVSDYRPIACCNVVYKIISKVICNRIKGVLGFLVDENQSAFIPSRQISDNIMLS